MPYATKEAKAANARRYYEANSDTIRAKTKAYYESNRATQYATSQKWRARNKDKVAEYSRTWTQRNPEWTRAYGRAAAHRRRGAKTDAASREYMEALAHDPCSYCSGPTEHIDHITPISKGGSGDWDNLTAACGSCNISKGAKPLLTFLLAPQGTR